MHEGPNAGTVAHERKLPFSHELELNIIWRAIKGAVAKRDPARANDGFLKVAYRGSGMTYWLIGVIN